MTQLVLPGSPPPPKESLSQWDTPAELAARIADWAIIPPGAKVLEPSAGLGSLAIACRAHWAKPRVFCVEIDRERAVWLASEGFNTFHDDFISLTPEWIGSFDMVVMNPPFEDGQDSLHIEHALRFAPIVIAHVPTRILCGKINHERIWSKHGLQHIAFCVSRPRYSGSDTTGRTDMCTIRIVRGEANWNDVDVEWWP